MMFLFIWSLILDHHEMLVKVNIVYLYISINFNIILINLLRSIINFYIIAKLTL